MMAWRRRIQRLHRDRRRPAGEKCPQCGKLMAVPAERTIIRKDRAPDGGNAIAHDRMTFCSAQCGGHYQMGCEG